MPFFREDQGKPWWADEHWLDKKSDDLKKDLKGFDERHNFDAQGQMDQFRKDLEDWEQGGGKGPIPVGPIDPGNIGMETGNFPVPEWMDVDPVTERLGVPEGFQFPPDTRPGPRDYPSNTPPIIFRPPPSVVPPLGPFPPLPSKPRGPNPFGPNPR